MQVGNNILIFSPHFDDAIFSCGGSIVNWLSQGKNIFICTIFSGIPDYNNISNFASRLTTSGWVEKRADENRVALEELMIKHVSLDFLEALFRKLADGSFECNSWEDIFSVRPNYLEYEISLMKALCKKVLGRFDLKEFDIFLPLAIGGHIDHRLIFGLSKFFINQNIKKNNVFYYEDLPYAAIGELNEDKFYSLNLFAEIQEISLDEKLAAVKFYETGLRMGEGEGRVIAAIKHHAVFIGQDSKAGERFWRY